MYLSMYLSQTKSRNIKVGQGRKETKPSNGRGKGSDLAEGLEELDSHTYDGRMG